VKPALVILAAGKSSRLGQCKALASIAPENALELLVRSGAAFDAIPPLVVSGADHALIASALPRGVEIAFNERWERGRTGGIQLAARVRAGFDLCLAPVDVPLVPREVFDALAQAWVEAGSPARGWLAPRCARGFGHPIVVGRALLEEISGLDPDEPLSSLRKRAEPLAAIEVLSDAILDDLDTPEDLERMRARFR
jgi:molybdenum cofactor cytidylyltransferase